MLAQKAERGVSWDEVAAELVALGVLGGEPKGETVRRAWWREQERRARKPGPSKRRPPRKAPAPPRVEIVRAPAVSQPPIPAAAPAAPEGNSLDRFKARNEARRAKLPGE
jgi:hypothetical protein